MQTGIEGIRRHTHTVINMKTSIIKSLLTSLYQREGKCPSLVKRGKGRFFNNDALLMHFLVRQKKLSNAGSGSLQLSNKRAYVHKNSLAE